MIEKIPDQIPVQTGEWRGTTFDIIPKETFGLACRKINELVDAVNELQKNREEIKEWIAIVADLRSRVPVVESRISILEEHVHPTATTEPADPYAEQRKWVGKLCRFWDEDDKNYFVFGILGKIDKDKQISRRRVIYFDSENSGWWEHCEPVKLDDDVIYKGGDNE